LQLSGLHNPNVVSSHELLETVQAFPENLHLDRLSRTVVQAPVTGDARLRPHSVELRRNRSHGANPFASVASDALFAIDGVFCGQQLIEPDQWKVSQELAEGHSVL
jgi:hypothetical protein